MNFSLVDSHGIQKVDLIEVVGQGGCGIAYKGILHPEDNQKRRVCVIKEYFPIEENLKQGVRYTRDDETGIVKILAESEALRLEEMKRQERNVQREIEMANRLFLEKTENDINNNPHFYQAYELTKKGDSTYVLLDTENGATLKALLCEKEDGKMMLTEAIRYTETLFQIIGQYFYGDKSYCHGDLKPENIWITDPGNAEGMVILDFGSVFAHDEYKIDIDKHTDQEIMSQADLIVENEGIGSSSEGYRDAKMLELSLAKHAYIQLRDIKNAVRLIKAINAIGISEDIYSGLQILFYLATGREYTADGSFSPRKVVELTGESRTVAEWLIHIMNANADGKYQKMEEAEEDLTVLKNLLNKNADPRVLLEGIKNDILLESGIDERLFANVVEIYS